MVSFLAEVKIFMDNNIVHGFIFVRRKKVVRKVCHSKGNEKRNLMALVSVA